MTDWCCILHRSGIFFSFALVLNPHEVVHKSLHRRWSYGTFQDWSASNARSYFQPQDESQTRAGPPAHRKKIILLNNPSGNTLYEAQALGQRSYHTKTFNPKLSTISIPENLKKGACLHSWFQSSLLSTVSFWSQMHSWGAEPPWANINREGRQGGTINTVWETLWDRQTATIPQCNAAHQRRQWWYFKAIWDVKMGRYGYLKI